MRALHLSSGIGDGPWGYTVFTIPGPWAKNKVLQPLRAARVAAAQRRPRPHVGVIVVVCYGCG